MSRRSKRLMRDRLGRVRRMALAPRVGAVLVGLVGLCACRQEKLEPCVDVEEGQRVEVTLVAEFSGADFNVPNCAELLGLAPQPLIGGRIGDFVGDNSCLTALAEIDSIAGWEVQPVRRGLNRSYDITFEGILSREGCKAQLSVAVDLDNPAPDPYSDLPWAVVLVGPPEEAPTEECPLCQFRFAVDVNLDP